MGLRNKLYFAFKAKGSLFMKENRLPLASLFALALSGFLAIMTETLPAGLLPNIAASLSVDNGAAGQLVTIYAVGSILAAIPVIGATKAWSRKKLFISSIAGFFIFNTLMTISPVYWLTLIARFAVGIAAGIVWGMLAGYARRMVPENLAGRAMAIALVGTPVALSFGVPLGTWLGNLFGWRAVFGIMSIYAALLLILILRVLPDFPGVHGTSGLSYKTVLTTRGVRPLLLITLFWLGAHNGFYTYIAPFLSNHNFDRVDFSLLIFGVAALISIVLTGYLIDSHLRALTLISLLLFIASAIMLALVKNPVLIDTFIILWGLSFGGAATLLQTALGQRVSNDALDYVMSLNATVWNVSIALGGLLGGLLVQGNHVDLFPWIVAALALLAFAIAAKHIGNNGEA